MDPVADHLAIGELHIVAHGHAGFDAEAQAGAERPAHAEAAAEGGARVAGEAVDAAEGHGDLGGEAEVEAAAETAEAVSEDTTHADDADKA